MKQMPIIYTSNFCSVCGMVKGFLDTLEVPYQEINIDLNPIRMFQLIAKTKRLSVPQTVINGKLISGFNPEKIMQALRE